MTDPDPADVLIDRVRRLLRDVCSVTAGADTSVTVAYDGIRAVMQAMTLAPGLDVLAVTQVLAWDLPNTDALRDDIDRLTTDLNFGSIKRGSQDVTTDVLAHYTFPAGSLDDAALLTMLTLILSTGAQASRALTD